MSAANRSLAFVPSIRDANQNEGKKKKKVQTNTERLTRIFAYLLSSVMGQEGREGGGKKGTGCRQYHFSVVGIQNRPLVRGRKGRRTALVEKTAGEFVNFSVRGPEGRKEEREDHPILAQTAARQVGPFPSLSTLIYRPASSAKEEGGEDSRRHRSQQTTTEGITHLLHGRLLECHERKR